MSDLKHRPPRWADQFLRWYCSEDLLEEIQGDLHEAYHNRVLEHGRFRAACWYVSDVMTFFGPYAFEKYSRAKQFLPMFNNYVKIALRNIFHRKAFAAINWIGLTIGVSAVMLIGIYLRHELTFDRSTPAHERIYRLVNSYRAQVYSPMFFKDYYNSSSETQLRLINHLKQFEGVESACHFVPSNSAIGGNDQYYLEIDNRQFVADNALYTNTGMAFNDLFPQEFLLGSPESAFSGFSKIIITEKLARDWFGFEWQRQDLLGKSVTIRGEPFELAAVIRSMPDNMHFDFDWIVHQKQIPSWAAYTYLKVAPHTKIESIIQQLGTSIDVVYPGYQEDELQKGVSAIALADIHFTRDTLYELKPIANKAYLTTFGLVGLVILLIVLTNYTNLSLAMYADRDKELGVRKVLGAHKRDITFQLVAEGVLLSLLCFPLCLLVLYFCIPYFVALMEIGMMQNPVLRGDILLSLFILLVCSGLLSALYPSLYSGKRSILSLFGKNAKRMRQIRWFNFRNALLGLQFIVVIGLISFTYFIFQQMEYIRTKDLGYTKEGVVFFDIDGAKKFQALKRSLLEIPEVEAVGANGVPGSEMFNQTTYKMENTDVTLDDGTLEYLDYGSLQTLGIQCDPCHQLKKGRDDVFLINRTAAEKLAKIRGVEPSDLIGEILITEPEWENEEYGFGIPKAIDGIIDDFKFFSLKYPNQSLLLDVVSQPEWVYTLMLRAQTDDWSSTLKRIENAYVAVEDVRPFDYNFLEDRLKQLYVDERRSSILMSGLSVIAIVLALLGLAGMVSYIAYGRQKEMSIRKILGASLARILLNFNKEFLLLLLFATGIAMPISLYFSSQWLESFAHRIEPTWWVVALAGALATILVVTTVTVQSLSAARKDPADVLRSE